MSRILSITLWATLFTLLSGAAVECRSDVKPATQQKARPAAFNDLSKRAQKAWDANQFEEASGLYRQAVALDPRWVEGWGRLAAALYNLNRYADAREAYRQTTALSPKNSAAWAFLGLCEYQVRDYDAAFTHLRKAEDLGLPPDRDLTAQVKYDLAILHDTRGQFEEGRKEISWFPEQNLGSPEIIEAIGLTILQQRWFPQEIPADQHDTIVKAGAAGFADISRQPDKARDLYQQLVTDYPKEPGVHFAFGHFLSKSDPDAALREYQIEIEVIPSHVPARLEAADVSLKLGRPDAALGYAQEASKLDPNNSAAHNLAGQALLATNRPADAIPELAAATRLSPLDLNFHLQLAQAYKATRQTEKASKEIATADQLQQKRPSQPSSTPSQSLGGKTPSDRFSALKQQASIAFQESRLDDAAKMYKDALQLRPAWTEGWGYLAALRFTQNRYSEARDAYRRTTVLTPKNGPSWAYLGFCEYELRDYPHAFDHLVKASRLGLGDDHALISKLHYELAMLWDTAGQFEMAQKEISFFAFTGDNSPLVIEASGLIALRMPVFPYEVPAAKHDFVMKVGEAAWFLNGNHVDDSQKRYKDLVVAYPQDPNLHYSYGLSLAIPDPVAAVAEFEKVLEVSPQHVPAMVEASLLCLNMGELDKSEELARRAIGLEPKNYAPHNLLGRSLLQDNHTAEGIQELEIAVRLAPSVATPHFNLAQAYQKAGKSAAAAKEFAAFKELNQRKEGQDAGGEANR